MVSIGGEVPQIMGMDSKNSSRLGSGNYTLVKGAPKHTRKKGEDVDFHLRFQPQIVRGVKFLVDRGSSIEPTPNSDSLNLSEDGVPTHPGEFAQARAKYLVRGGIKVVTLPDTLSRPSDFQADSQSGTDLGFQLRRDSRQP